MALDGESRQHDIAVPAALVPLVFPEREVESEFLGNVPGLVLFARTALVAHNFLESHDVGA